MGYQKIIDYVKRNGPRSVCVEAGHVYMNEYPSEMHRKLASVGADISIQISQSGCNVSKVLFVDDYNPSHSDFCLDLPKYIKVLSEEGFAPDIVTFEANLVAPAKNIIRELNGRVVHNADGNSYLNSDRILCGGRPTCNLLDAALYVAKLSIFELAITVLPKYIKDNNTYIHQQKKVKRILKEIGYKDPSIINVFLSNDGDLEVFT